LKLFERFEPFNTFNKKLASERRLLAIGIAFGAD